MKSALPEMMSAPAEFQRRAQKPGAAGLRVLDIWCHASPKFGGVGPAAAELAGEVCRSEGWKSSLTAVCDPDEFELADGIPATVSRIHIGAPRPLADLRVTSSLEAAIRECDVCHVHGMWLPHTLAARRIARQMGRPVVSSVHGMLERWELANKGLKKRVYSALLERRSLAASDCLRALSDSEAQDYRRYGVRTPIAVIPNGVRRMARVNPETLYAKFPSLRGKKIVLFLSRIHYKKGILNLVEAMRPVAANDKRAHLLVAGADFEGTEQKARAMVDQLGLRECVTFAGTLSGDMKLAALSAARYLCLPSYSEGLSVAVLEALSVGLPVIVSPACNMNQVSACGAGAVTSNEAAELAATLSEYLKRDDPEWWQMCEDAAMLSRQQFGWARIGDSMRRVYLWLAGGPRPDFLVD